MITVRACKYDGAGDRTWKAQILRQEGSLLVLDATFDREIQHDFLGTIACGTSSVEYYWLDRWYNIFRFAKPSGELRGFYCNINLPPVFNGELLSYVDLDIDILVEPDFSFRTIDLEEFEDNTVRLGYSAEIRAGAERAVEELSKMIQTRAYPFSDEAF